MTARSGQELSARDLLERLVGFPTVSSDSNLVLIDFIRDYLTGWGIESRVTPSADGHKANLFASIGGASGKLDGGIVLSGHTDVVPVEGQPWSTDPFKIVERDGKLFGRGTCDMKGFVALALAQVPRLTKANLSEPIHLAFSYDEEVGCVGVPGLLADLRKAGIRPRLAVIGEPTGMKVANAHKGINGFLTEITGVPVHSSQPSRGVNAIQMGARFIGLIDRMALEAEGRAKPEVDFDPPFTTFNVGTIAGGKAVNIIAGHTEILWEFRTVPWDDPAWLEATIEERVAAELRRPMQLKDPRADIVTRAVCGAPALRADPESPAEKLALALTGQNRATTVAFGTEAGLFQEAGIPAIICGPGYIDQAHQPDEFIALDQFAAGGQFLDRLIAGLETA